MQSVADPRLRVLPNLVVDNLQTINFNGSESLDINTFGIDPIIGLRIFTYNSTQTFSYYGKYDSNFFYFFSIYHYNYFVNS
jgi:hypothetical protein